MTKIKFAGIIFWIIFIAALIFFSVCTTKTGIHDTGEYITLSKELAGINNVKVFSAHSIVYPFFIAQFLKIFPSLITIKLLGALWLLLIGILLYFTLKNKKAFLIWIFSPLVWYILPEVSPIMPIAFFFLLSYIYLKKWENTKSKYSFVISALSLGLCLSLYTAFFIIFILFIIFYFYNKNFKQFFWYFILTLPTISIRFILDEIYFGMPLTTLIRYFGTNIAGILLGGPNRPLVLSSLPWLILEIIIYMVPLLFLIYKIDTSKNKKNLIFLGLLVLFFAIRGSEPRAIKYFIMFSPLIVLLMSQVLKRKTLFINTLISIIIILNIVMPFFNYPYSDKYFGENDHYLIEQDLNQIKKDFDFKEVIAGKDQALILATYSWTEYPKFIWWREYELSKKNEEYFSKYSIETDPKINQLKILEIQAGLKRTDDRTFEDLPIIKTKQKNQVIPEGYRLIKEYDILQVYTK